MNISTMQPWLPAFVKMDEDFIHDVSFNLENYLVQRFVKMSATYDDAEIIREFVEKIIIYKAEKVDGHRTQRIQIIYNCIGAVALPENQSSRRGRLTPDLSHHRAYRSVHGGSN